MYCKAAVVVTLIKITSWNQRVIPSPGTMIGIRPDREGWELYLEAARGEYLHTATHLGHGYAALHQED